MKIGSLFSGGGGLDAAVGHAFGGETVWHCEQDEAASKVLAHHWPNVPNLGDITAVDWADVEPIDVLCGGWPCQPFSLAGKRKGAEDERALWPYVAGAVRILRPRYIVLENVPGIFTAGEFGRVANDLAACGYDLRWTCLRASDIGAPHRRERIFIVATDACDGWHEGWPESARPVGGSDAAERGDGPVTLLPTPRSSDCAGPGLHGTGGMDLRTTVAFPGWGKYEPAIRHWETLTRPAPNPTEPNTKGNPRLSAAFAQWLMGWPAGWVTDPAIGISRNNQLRIIGNGVVTRQAAAAITQLLNVAVVA